MPYPNSSTDKSQPSHLLFQLLNIRGDQSELQPDLIRDVEWDGIVNLALKQGVAPLLYWRLSNNRRIVPPRVLQDLNDEYVATALRNMRLCKELNRIVGALEKANITLLVLKGAHIAQVAYGNLALRPMNDLDVLVERQDLTHAEQVIQALGYVPHPDFPDHEWALQNHYHFCYYLPDDGTILELHWHIEIRTSPFKVDVAGLFDRSLDVALVGIPTRVLSPEDLVLCLCIQISYHHVFDFAAIRTLYDLAYVIRAYSDRMDWESLGTRANEWRATRCVYLGLRLAGEMTGADVPAGALGSLAPSDFDPRLLRWAMDRMLTDTNENADPALIFSEGFGSVWNSDNLSGKFAVLLKTCFPSKEKIAEMYALSPESKLIYLQYPRRLKELSSRYARHIWGLAQGDETTKAWMEREGKRMALMTWITADER